MKTAIVIQARLESTRMHHKMLQPLGPKPILWHVVDRCQRTGLPVIVAMPTDSARVLSLVLPDGTKVHEYDGDENDLVGRYVDAALYHDIDIICRVPADNPAVDPLVISWHLENFKKRPQIFSSSQLYRTQFGVIDGLGCEICFPGYYEMMDEVLEKDSPHREHPHIYFNQKGSLSYPFYQKGFQDRIIRLDINTVDEYLALKQPFEACYEQDPHFYGFDLARLIAEGALPEKS